jgi:hypothetical protein
VNRKRTVSLTLAELNHLLGLLYDRKVSGEYCGARGQYYARTESLIARLEDAVHGPEEEGK